MHNPEVLLYHGCRHVFIFLYENLRISMLEQHYPTNEEGKRNSLESFWSFLLLLVETGYSQGKILSQQLTSASANQRPDFNVFNN